VKFTKRYKINHGKKEKKVITGHRMITNEIKSFLLKNGADLVGFANLKNISKDIRGNFDYGIVIGLKYSKEAIEKNKNGDLNQYYKEYNELNDKLDKLASLTEKMLIDKGHDAIAKLRSMVKYDENFNSLLPHKTVATLAGVGWIGKNGLLITKEFGSAIRIIVVLTKTPLKCGNPIEQSSCIYTCNTCANVCPGNSVSGRIWNKNMERDNFYDAKSCFEFARKYAKEKLAIDEAICGLCISNCPFTQRALNY